MTNNTTVNPTTGQSSNPHRTINNEIVVTGLGMLTAHGLGMTANNDAFQAPPARSTQDELKIVGFNPAPHLTDRKVVKVVSHRDVLGLVAFEECLKNSGLSPKTINPDRTGLYVGAPPSSCIDHHNYNEGIDASIDAYGILQEKEFGENFRSASPTTLLTGLPNNVLCYGAKTLDARGPNSNYTTLETSGHMAVMGAMRAMRLNRIDCAIAGGYTAHSDRLFAASMRQRGLDKATPVAEGASFATIETRSNATARGAKVICQIMACNAGTDAEGPFKAKAESPILADLMISALQVANLMPEQIEIVMTSSCGIATVDAAELFAIKTVWSQDYMPIMATTATRWGNLMEAGGIAEIGFLSKCYANKSIPQSVILGANEKAHQFNSDRKHALIIRATPYGEYTCLVVKMEAL